MRIALLALGLATAAHAQTNSASDEEARSLFQAGEVAFEQGQFERALEHFTRAYELSPRPELLFNIGNVQERLDHDREALQAFERFVAARGDSPNAGFARARIQALQASIAAGGPAPEAAV